MHRRDRGDERLGFRTLSLGTVVLLGLSLAVLVQAGPVTAAQQQPMDSAALIAAARNTQRATRAKLQVLGDAFVCPDARFVAYRRSDFEPDFVDHWYVSSQLWADVALQAAVAPIQQNDVSIVPPDDWNMDDSRCYIDKTDVFLDRQWDYEAGGYYPRSNATGTSVDPGARYGDDNALTGLTLIDLAQNTGLAGGRQQYLHAAREQANFLMTGGLWDDQFGGGFWWNTTKGSTEEGKPAQTNALAALFFGRLYQLTGDVTYRSWMLRTLLWLDTILYDPDKHLYRWSVSYRDIPNRSGAIFSSRYLNYDQSIAIQAQLLAMRVDGDPNRLSRAMATGEAIQSTFWVPVRGYVLESGGAQMYTSYGAWTSLGHLALYDATADSRWLEWAQNNLEALSGDLRSTDGGFGTQVFQCVGGLAQYCPPGDTGWIVDHIRDGAAQAWVQQLQVALALRVAGPVTENIDPPRQATP